MKSLFLALAILPIFGFAQTTPKVTYNFENNIDGLMGLYKEYNRKNDQTDGYRIQIMFSNDKSEAYSAKVKLYKEFPTENCYVDYEQPYYKLRMGDYVNRFEANYALQQLLALYPASFIIKSKVAVKL